MSSVIVESIGFGIVDASIISIGAMGFSLQFGLTNVFNIAYGTVLTLGAFAAYIAEQMGILGWYDVLIGAGVGVIATLLIGKGVLSTFARRSLGLFELITVSLAVELVVQYSVDAADGEQLFNYSFSQGRSFRFLGMVFTATELEIIGVAIGAFVLLECLLRLTRTGKALRAVAEEPRLARACGIPTSKIVNVTWVLSGALAGVAGGVGAPGGHRGTYSATVLLEARPGATPAARGGGQHPAARHNHPRTNPPGGAGRTRPACAPGHTPPPPRAAPPRRRAAPAGPAGPQAVPGAGVPAGVSDVGGDVRIPRCRSRSASHSIPLGPRMASCQPSSTASRVAWSGTVPRTMTVSPSTSLSSTSRACETWMPPNGSAQPPGAGSRMT